MKLDPSASFRSLDVKGCLREKARLLNIVTVFGYSHYPKILDVLLRTTFEQVARHGPACHLTTNFKYNFEN